MSQPKHKIDNRPPKHLRVLTKGHRRDDGMVFLQYANDYKNGEWWVTESRFIEINQLHRKNKNRYKRSEKGKAAQRRYETKKRATSPAYRVRKNCRDRLHSAVKQQSSQKSSGTATLVGCSIPKLMNHLETLFQEGMTWANYGEWHIDHKRPCASFNLLEPLEQRVCFHFSNLQPLWAKDNQKKSDSYED